jgi:hypothetical protein
MGSIPSQLVPLHYLARAGNLTGRCLKHGAQGKSDGGAEADLHRADKCLTSKFQRRTELVVVCA